MHVTAIIAAGGRGRRLGAEVPKQFLSLGGRPMLQWSLEAFLACDGVTDLVVVVPPELIASPPEYLLRPRVRLVAGGERRQDSVANGFELVAPHADVVLIHDAARPLVDQATIRRTIAAASTHGAAVAALASRDTVKWACSQTDGDGPTVERTLPRERVYLAQTPQAFRRAVLADAVAAGRRGIDGTDEAALAECAGHAVRLVEGHGRNLKITTADDLMVAEAWLRQGGDMPSSRLRVGSGYDLHRLVEGRPLVIGGVTIPFERGLAGHSDADLLCHAITDAVLGAAAAGDIGQHFPDSDERWRGASSLDLLRQVVELIRCRGFEIVNVDATILAQRPKLGPHRDAIVAAVAGAMGVAADVVSVKAKTNEGVDAVGRGEAMAAHAVVLIERR